MNSLKGDTFRQRAANRISKWRKQGLIKLVNANLGVRRQFMGKTASPGKG